jgi:hypothetical protein
LVPELDLVAGVDEREPVLLRERTDPERPDEPDDPDERDAVDVAAAVATGVAALCAWKPSTAAVPKTVAEMTMGARLIAGCSSEGE